MSTAQNGRGRQSSKGYHRGDGGGMTRGLEVMEFKMGDINVVGEISMVQSCLGRGVQQTGSKVPEGET